MANQNITGLNPQSTFVSGGGGVRRLILISTTDTQGVVEAAGYLKRGDIGPRINDGDILEVTGNGFTQRYVADAGAANDYVLTRAGGSSGGGGGGASYTPADFAIDFATKDTDDLVEGAANLYWTPARFDAALAAKTTTNLAEGTNLYFTPARWLTQFNAASILGLADIPDAYGTPGQSLVVDPAGTSLIWQTGAAGPLPAALPPVTPVSNIAVIGTGTRYAREDHRHAVQEISTDALLGGINLLTIGTDGLHSLQSELLYGGTVSPAADNAVGLKGVSSAAARVDHKHPAQGVSATTPDLNLLTVDPTDGLHALLAANCRSTDANNSLLVGTDDRLFVANAAKNRLFADDTTVNPAFAAEPTVAEITIFALAQVPAYTNGIIYYNGSDAPGLPSTFVYHVDASGTVTLIQGNVSGERSKYRGVYDTSSEYFFNELALYNNSLYRSNTDRAPGVWPAIPPVNGPGSFTRVSGAIRGVFDSLANYSVGDVVMQLTGTGIGPRLGFYLAVAAHSAGDAPTPGDWKPIAVAAAFVGDYQSFDYVYAVGDVVIQAGTIYRCITAHGVEGALTAFTPANWTALTAPPDVTVATLALVPSPGTLPSGTVYRVTNDAPNNGLWMVLGTPGSNGNVLERI